MSENSIKTIQAGGTLAPIVPRNFDDVARLANLACMAGMFANSDQGKAQATMAIMQGLDIGVPPMQAVQQIAVINGRCQVWGDLLPALIWSNGHKIKEWFEGEGEQLVAHCRITRGDNGEVIERDFSHNDAKEAGLLGKDLYKKYRKRMFQMRARGYCARDAVPDVLRGMAIREEMEDTQPLRDITPKAPPAPPAPPPPPVIEAQVEPTFDVAGFMTRLSTELDMAQDAEALGETWAHWEAVMEDNLSRNEREDALDIYREQEARIAANSNASLKSAKRDEPDQQVNPSA